MRTSDILSLPLFWLLLQQQQHQQHQQQYSGSRYSGLRPFFYRQREVYEYMAFFQPYRQPNPTQFTSKVDVMNFKIRVLNYSEVYYVTVTWQKRYLNLQHAVIRRRIRNGIRHSMLTISKGQKDHYRQAGNYIDERQFHAHPQLLLRANAWFNYINPCDDDA